MRLISNKALTEFAALYTEADSPLQAWRKIVEAGTFSNYAALKKAFNATDRVGDYYVFDIGGNKYRLIAAIHFNRQMIFVRHVFTHFRLELEVWSTTIADASTLEDGWWADPRTLGKEALPTVFVKVLAAAGFE